jgi:hypothetical protein
MQTISECMTEMNLTHRTLRESVTIKDGETCALLIGIIKHCQQPRSLLTIALAYGYNFASEYLGLGVPVVDCLGVPIELPQAGSR